MQAIEATDLSIINVLGNIKFREYEISYLYQRRALESTINVDLKLTPMTNEKE